MYVWKNVELFLFLFLAFDGSEVELPYTNEGMIVCM